PVPAWWTLRSSHLVNRPSFLTAPCRLPLALQIIAALLAEDLGRSLPMMAVDLSDAAFLLEEMQIGERAVRAAFALSYQRLGPQRARLFRLLPVNSGPDILIPSTAALPGMDVP